MRIRSIKPEFWRSDDIVQLRRELRLLFIGLWSYCDDNGVGVDDYRQIAADLFGLEDDPVGARNFVRDGLATLSAVGLIVRYHGPTRPLLYIPTWDKHQRVDKPGKPRHPRPDESGAIVETSTNADSGGVESDAAGNVDSAFATLSRHSRETPAPGAGEQGSRGAGEQGSSSPSARKARDDGGDGTDPCDRPDVTLICEHLADRIEANGSKRPTITKRWRDAARLMIDADGRTVEQITGAINWCQDDEFWRANILSMSKLRSKYDQLRLAAQRNGARANGSTTDRRIAEIQALKTPKPDRLEITDGP